MTGPEISPASVPCKVSVVKDEKTGTWKSVFSNPVDGKTVAEEGSVEKASIDLKNVPGGSCLETLKKVGLLAVNVGALPFRLVFGLAAISVSRALFVLSTLCDYPIKRALCFACDLNVFLLKFSPNHGEDVPIWNESDVHGKSVQNTSDGRTGVAVAMSIWNNDGGYGTLPAIADSFALLFRKDLTVDAGRAALRAEYLIEHSKDPIMIALKRDDKECIQALFKKKPSLVWKFNSPQTELSVSESELVDNCKQVLFEDLASKIKEADTEGKKKELFQSLIKGEEGGLEKNLESILRLGSDSGKGVDRIKEVGSFLWSQAPFDIQLKTSAFLESSQKDQIVKEIASKNSLKISHLISLGSHSNCMLFNHLADKIKEADTESKKKELFQSLVGEQKDLQKNVQAILPLDLEKLEEGDEKIVLKFIEDQNYLARILTDI